MAERGLAALDAGQRERLAAMGYELLSLRPSASRAASASGAAPSVAAPVPKRSTSPARLVLKVAPSEPFTGPHAALLRALIAALGLRDSEVSLEGVAGVPTIALGTEAVGAIRAPAPEQLRDAQSKRALWPVLRGLRRQLQGVGERE